MDTGCAGAAASALGRDAARFEHARRPVPSPRPALHSTNRTISFPAMTPGRAPRTTLEYALIGLIRECPRSGYELRKVFVETAMAGYSGSPGAIYPALRRLEADGLIEGTEQP